MSDYPPSVDAVRRRLLVRLGPLADQLRPGFLTAVCRLSLHPGAVDEIAAVAESWCRAFVDDPADDELAPLVELSAAELYGSGADAWRPAADPPAALARRLRETGARRAWLCRGQALTLSDGRRLVAVLTAAGLEPRPYGTTNRCRPAEISAGFQRGDALLWAAAGDFALGGFVHHPDPGELAALAAELQAPLGLLYDAWKRPPPDVVDAPTALNPAAGPGLVRGCPAPTPETTDLRRLFIHLRQRLADLETP